MKQMYQISYLDMLMWDSVGKKSVLFFRECKSIVLYYRAQNHTKAEGLS